MEGRHPACLLQLALAVQAELAELAVAGKPVADMLAAEAVPVPGSRPAVPLAFIQEAGECQPRSQ